MSYISPSCETIEKGATQLPFYSLNLMQGCVFPPYQPWFPATQWHSDMYYITQISYIEKKRKTLQCDNKLPNNHNYDIYWNPLFFQNTLSFIILGPKHFKITLLCHAIIFLYFCLSKQNSTYSYCNLWHRKMNTTRTTPLPGGRFPVHVFKRFWHLETID